ncbi:MAG: baseplate J/gp47 family protein [Trichormus sp. ATA11-4-KO1]|jgi:hypothetical protein|nr:baseplate J/gp47 family protein [Trichormus sp. ATA11-4-KO1]
MAEIPKLILDNQNEDELVQLAYNRIREASNGQLNDFRPGSPVAALVEGQMFGIAELLFYLNMLPEALALESFRLLGVTRSDGTKASGYLRFLLQTPLASEFVVNPGYAVPYKDSFFILAEQLVIPPGATEADVLVTAARTGSDLNVPEFALTLTNPGINFLQGIYNPQALTGGSDLEDITNTISRAQQQLRSREVLVSATDYELAAQDELGDGSKAVCIPFLNSDKTVEVPGQVHLFLCDSTGTPASTGTCQVIQAALQLRSFAASKVWVSPCLLDSLAIEITCGVDEVSETLATQIAQAVYDYLSPLTYPWGTKVKINEISYNARLVPGVTEVDSVTINGEPLDHLLANNWTSPFTDSLMINLMQPDGVSQTYFLGLGEDLD